MVSASLGATGTISTLTSRTSKTFAQLSGKSPDCPLSILLKYCREIPAFLATLVWLKSLSINSFFILFRISSVILVRNITQRYITEMSFVKQCLTMYINMCTIDSSLNPTRSKDGSNLIHISLRMYMNITTNPIATTTLHPLTSRTKRCSICNKPIDANSKEIATIGPVGPQCHKKFALVEEGLKQLDGKRFTNHFQVQKIISELAKLGLKAKAVKHGHIFKSETWEWSIEITGQLHQTAKRREKYGATFSDNRKRYANHLKAAAAKRHQVQA